MRKLAPQVSYETASQLLSYDPDSGDLLWKKDNRRAKAGKPAGCPTPDGYLVVTLNGAKIRGQYLAWLLHYGEWPRTTVRMRSTFGLDPRDPAVRNARQDISIDNLVLADTVLSDSPAAKRYRHYASERRRTREQYERDAAMRAVSNYRNVEFDPAANLWLVRQLFPLTTERSPTYDMVRASAAILGTYPDLVSAEMAAQDIYANREYLTDPITGKDKIPPPLPPGVGQLTAGPLGPDLADLHDKLAYAPADGILIWRKGPKQYQNAAVPTTGRTSYVPYLTWRLPAHSLAFFLTNGVWPLRGTIWPYDGNWRNIQLANLLYKHAGVTKYPIGPLANKEPQP